MPANPYFAADIRALEGRGVDAQMMGEVKQRTAQPKIEELVKQIRGAFRGVRLGDGVGLKEAGGLDDYADEATLARLRREDERQDWMRLPMETLTTFDSSLTFTDEAGMHFFLPAFLIAELLGIYQGISLFSTLCHGGPGGQFRLFTASQRGVVRAFLQHAADDPEHDLLREDILSALQATGYWAEAWDTPGWH